MSRLGILFAAGLIVAAQAIAAEAPDHRAPTAGTSLASPGLKISGNVTGLLPGQTKRIRVRVKNRLNRRVTLRLLTVIPSGDPRKCPATSLRIQGFRGHVAIRPHATRTVRLRVRLSPNAGDGCQRFSFPLRYRARAGS